MQLCARVSPARAKRTPRNASVLMLTSRACLRCMRTSPVHGNQRFRIARRILAVSTTNQLRLLIGMPDPASLGGPATCEPPFVAELRKQGVAVEEEIYVYGDKLSR